MTAFHKSGQYVFAGGGLLLYRMDVEEVQRSQKLTKLAATLRLK